MICVFSVSGGGEVKDERAGGTTVVTGANETCSEVARVVGGGGEATRDNEAIQDVSESSLGNLNDIERFMSPQSVSWIFCNLQYEDVPTSRLSLASPLLYVLRVLERKILPVLKTTRHSKLILWQVHRQPSLAAVSSAIHTCP
jgi:hypothetical protein